MLRFSLAALLLFVLAAGLGCTALINASPLWGAIVFTVTILILAVSVLVAWQWQGSGRAFAVGFALWGCGYLGLVLWDANASSSAGLGFADSTGVNTRWLFTEELLVQLDDEIQGTQTPWFQSTQVLSGGGFGGGFGGGGFGGGGGFFSVPSDGNGLNTQGAAGPGGTADNNAGGLGATVQFGGPFPGGAPPAPAMLNRKPEFYRIGHCLWALLLGLLGGTISRTLFVSGKRRAQLQVG